MPQDYSHITSEPVPSCIMTNSERNMLTCKEIICYMFYVFKNLQNDKYCLFFCHAEMSSNTFIKNQMVLVYKTE